MRVVLRPHPTSPRAGELVVDVERIADGRLHIWYRLSAASDLRLSHEGSQLTGQRRDELWQHTCCEAFIMTRGGYYEFNFAPTGDWAAYSFTGYREGLNRPELVAPNVSAHRRGDYWQLQAFVDLSFAPELTDGRPLRIALSAVLEAKDGSKTYWALAHPSDKPDFHHPDSFVLDLP